MSDSTTIRVILVDDHPVVRFGLAAIIGLQPDMVVVAEAESGEEACAVCAKSAADVVLMDLRLPGLSGVEAIRAIRKTHPSAVRIGQGGARLLFRGHLFGATFGPLLPFFLNFSQSLLGFSCSLLELPRSPQPGSLTAL